MTLEELWEQAIEEKRLSEEYVDALIAQCPREVAGLLGSATHVEIELPNGFTVGGRAAVINKDEFDIEIGTKIALRRIKDQILQLEGYRLQQEIYERSVSVIADAFGSE